MTTVVTAAVESPVTLQEVKDHLRIDVTDDDRLLNSLIYAATAYCEKVANRSFVSRTLDWTLDRFPPATGFYLPRPPVVSVTSITYIDEDGNSDTVSSSNYIVDTDSGRVALTNAGEWPSVTLRRIAGVTIRYVAGYGTTRSSVPETFRHAVLLVIGDWYEHRENSIIGQTSKAVDIGVSRLLMVDKNYIGLM